MRSHNFVRAVLRTAARNGSLSQVVARPTPLNLAQQSAARITAAASSSSLRAFSSSPVDLKKKSKKNAFSAIEEDLEQPEEDAFEQDDDLFGGVADSASSTSPASSSSSSSAMSRVEYAQALEAYSASLSWESIDRGQIPSLQKWRQLATQARTKEELLQVLELAKTYRDRVGSLGVESGVKFASRASRRFPELALNAFCDRYTYGLEYDLDSLRTVQAGLARKLGRGREEILESVELEGSPVAETDLLGVLAESTEAETTEGGAEGGKAEAVEAKHELDMPLARAKLSLLDRMSLLTSLSATLPSHSLQRSLDPILLAYLTRAYIQAFHLTQPHTTHNPLLEKVFQRTDQLVALLTQSALLTSDTKAEPSGLQRNLSTILTYVAVRGQKKFKGADGGKLDPVRTLYRYMDRVDREKSNELVRKVEPLLQSNLSL